MANRRTKSARKKTQGHAQAADLTTRSGSAPTTGVPVTLWVAATLVALEALATVGVGGWLLVEAIVERPRGLAIALSTGAFILAAGAGLGVVAWGLSRARRWSRGLVVVSQLLMLPLGYELLSGSTWAAGTAMMVAALVTIGLVVAPRSTAAFG